MNRKKKEKKEKGPKLIMTSKNKNRRKKE